MHHLDRRRAAGIASLAAVGLLAAALGAWRIRPLTEGMVGYDTAASVLYFDRIAAGLRLEGFVEATPKALLTLVDGVVFGLVHDWRALSVLAVIGYALNITLATWLAARLGGLPAAGFALAGMLCSAPLLDDAAYAYAVGPAMTGWLAAGLAITAPRPRYVVGGLALAVAGLARYETVLLDGAAVGVLALSWIATRSRHAPPPPRGAWWLALGFASVGVQAVHDWLLTGDPLWAVEVSGIVSTFRSVLGVSQVVHLITTHYTPGLAVLALAAVGAAGLAWRRRWAMLLGVAVLAPGVLAFQVALAMKGVYVSARYLYPADLALVFAAALGAGELWSLAERLVPKGWPARARVASGVIAGLVAAALGVVSVTAFTPVVPTITNRIATNAAIYANEATVLPVLRQALAAAPAGQLDRPAVADPRSRDRTAAELVVPVLLIPRLAVDLGIPVTSLADSGMPQVAPGGVPRAGQLVMHEGHLDRPVGDFAFLEVDAPTKDGTATLVPLFVDAQRGVWVLRVTP